MVGWRGEVIRRNVDHVAGSVVGDNSIPGGADSAKRFGAIHISAILNNGRGTLVISILINTRDNEKY